MRRQEDVTGGIGAGISCFRFLIFATWSLALVVVGVTLGKQLQFSWLSTSSDNSVGGPRGSPPWIVSDGSTPGQGTVLFVDPHNHHGENGNEMGHGENAKNPNEEHHEDRDDSKASLRESAAKHASSGKNVEAKWKDSLKTKKESARANLENGAVETHSASAASSSTSSKTTSTSELAHTNDASSIIG